MVVVVVVFEDGEDVMAMMMMVVVVAMVMMLVPMTVVMVGIFLCFHFLQLFSLHYSQISSLQGGDRTSDGDCISEQKT